MRLKEEAPLARPLHIHSGVGLLQIPQTVASEGANNPTEELLGTQWLSNYDNLTTSKVDPPENTVQHHHHQQHLSFVINNNLDNSKTGCKVLTDTNSNHPEDDNSTTHALPNNHQHMRSNINVPMEDTVSSMSVSSPDDDDIGDCEDSIKNPSFEDTLPDGEESGGESTTSSSESDEDPEVTGGRRPKHMRRGTGILNPNYPGFQRYAKRLHFAVQEETKTVDPIITGNINNNNNGVELNQLDGKVKTFDKSVIYTKSKLNIPVVEEVCPGDAETAEGSRREKEVNVVSEVHSLVVPMAMSEKSTVDSIVEQETKMKADVKMADAYLSGVNEDISVVALLPKKMFGLEERVKSEEEKFMKEDWKKEPAEALTNSPHKREKMEINYSVRMAAMAVQSQTASAPDVIPQGTRSTAKQVKVKQPVLVSSNGKTTPGWVKVTRREGSSLRNVPKRRSLPAGKEKWRTDISGSFDVYNIETAMPKIDLDAIESHLRAAKEEENRRRNDREEIRRRLAMDPDDYYGPMGDRQGGRKPSLQSRLQSGMNLQICFMNETVSDGESPSGSDGESPSVLSSSLPSRLPSTRMHCSFAFNAAVEPSLETTLRGNQDMVPSAGEGSKPSPPRSLSLKTNLSRGAHSLPHAAGRGVLGRWDILGSGGSAEQNAINWDMEDFFSRQARLQAEARMALAQAKEMAHMQMEVERQRQKINSPITQMVRASLLKVGQVFPADRRRVSRQMLTEMNVAQLQVIVNDLHSQIEVLNEDLVKLLMERDDLHMEQDSMLVDIEDLTRYLGAKEKALKESGRGVGSSREDSDPVGRLSSLPLLFRPKTTSQQRLCKK